jgi:PPP family 3-phenylpropionic acid transporter
MDARPDLLLRFLLIYAALYCSFGLSSPFLPEFLMLRGVEPESLGVLLGAGTAIRLISAPVAGRLADVFGVFRLELGLFAISAAVASLLYLPAHSFWPLVLVNLAQAALLAPLAPLSDALALSWSSFASHGEPNRFEYGWVRGAGSAAFVAGTLVAGQVASAWGLPSVLLLTAGGLFATGLSTRFAPDLKPKGVQTMPARNVLKRDWVALLREPAFVRMALAAALVLGSHAMHDAFAIIRWSDAGISPAGSSVLWSESFCSPWPLVVECNRHQGIISVGSRRGHNALGGDGSNCQRDGPCRNRAAPRAHVRAVSLGVHADHC